MQFLTKRAACEVLKYVGDALRPTAVVGGAQARRSRRVCHLRLSLDDPLRTLDELFGTGRRGRLRQRNSDRLRRGQDREVGNAQVRDVGKPRQVSDAVPAVRIAGPMVQPDENRVENRLLYLK